jgi:hypothetical protein
MDRREAGLMNLKCEKRCKFLRKLANLKCPGCFGAEVSVAEEGKCDCKLTINPDTIWRWE